MATVNSKKIRRIKQKKALISSRERNNVVICLFVLTIGVFLMGICNLILLANNNRLAGKKTVFVQQGDGTTIIAKEQDRNYRSDEVIRKSVAKWLTMMWEWNSFIPGTQTRDKGISIGNPKEKVPTRVYMASYLLEPNLRWEYLKAMMKEIPQEFYTKKVRSVFEIHFIGKPIRKGDTYEVNVIASRTDINESSQVRRSSRYEKTIVLKTIEPYKSVDAETSAFNKQLEDLLQAGISIIEIKDFNPNDL